MFCILTNVLHPDGSTPYDLLGLIGFEIYWFYLPDSGGNTASVVVVPPYIKGNLFQTICALSHFALISTVKGVAFQCLALI
eukprot:12430205-Ditylum_brightwellii.AAC.1